MKRFSVSEAIAEPFRQAGRRPLSTLVWGLLLLAPTVIVFAAMFPMLSEMVASGAFEAGADPSTTPFGDDFGQVLQFQIWSQLANLLQLFGALFVTTAIIRSVFSGRRGDRTAFLRIGMDELYVAVAAVAIWIGMVVLIVVAVLLAVAIGLALAGVADPWRVLIYVGMGVVLAVGFLALFGRLALIAPASMRYNTFAFVEGWALGRGQTGRLLGLLIVQFLVAMVLGMALMLLFVLVALMVGGGLAATDPEAMLEWMRSLPEQPALLAGLVAILLLPLAWVQGFCNLLATAPFARAVIDLAAEPALTAEPISADTGRTGD